MVRVGAKCRRIHPTGDAVSYAKTMATTVRKKVATFLLGQASVACRLALRCLFFGGEAQLPAGFNPDPSRPVE